MKIIKKFITALISIVLLFAIIIIVENFIEEYYIYQMGNTVPFVASGNSSSLPMILGMVFFGILIWLYWPYGLFGNENEVGIKAKFPRQVKWIITGISAVIIMVLIILSTQWMTFFTTEGIVDIDFGKKTEYSWEEVESFEIDFDSHDILMFILHMDDGEEYFFNGGFWRWCEYMNDAYEEQFQEGCYDYMPWLASKLRTYGAKMKLDNWEERLKDSSYDSWTECAEDIRAAYENAK